MYKIATLCKITIYYDKSIRLESNMAFRTDEKIKDGEEFAIKFLLSQLKNLDNDDFLESKSKLTSLFLKLGPVIDEYPNWHPLVQNKIEGLMYDPTTPNTDCGYNGLDHTIHFLNGFITCPYDDGQAVIDSVNKLKPHSIAHITAERLDIKLYAASANPILVLCEWAKPLANDGTIPLSIVAPLLLEQELPNWIDSQVAETWETMRPYFLGCPHGKRSSLFVNQETGQGIKKLWESIINTGMFGQIMPR